jgi:putative ABC transport system permease protein
MFLLTVILKNLLHRPARTVLTVTGIGIGAGVVVSLISIAWGFQRGWEKIYAARGTDLILVRATSDNPMPELFDETAVRGLDRVPGVEAVSLVYDDVMGIEDAPMVLVFGWEVRSFLWRHLRLVAGRWPTNDLERVVMLGSVAADVLGKTSGDRVAMEMDELTVCGVFESDAFLENGSVIVPLRRLQRLTDNAGRVRHINIRTRDAVRPEEVRDMARAIEARHPGFRAYGAGEIARENLGLQTAKALSWAVSVIALIVGAVGITNTALMSVFERIPEIGILLAIGWRRGRIVRMILWESLALSLLGGGVGCGFGVLLVRLHQAVPVMKGKIEGEIRPELFAAVIGMALALGILGGIYPAVRGARLLPTEAIRRESCGA